MSHSGPIDNPADEPPHIPARGGRLAVQIVGIAVSLGLLAWCLSRALSDANRAKLAALRDVPASLLAALLGLSLLSLALTGLAFWCTVRPARRLDLAGVESVNAVASFLGYLPFKLSLISRVVLHNRRDGLPILTGGAWLVAQAITMLACLTPIAGAGLWRGRIDATYAAAAAGGLVLAWGVLVGLARTFAGERGLSRLHAIADRLGPLSRLARSPSFSRLHAGVDMLAHPRAVAGSMLVRTLDLAAQSARFVVAAKALNVELTWDGAILAASTFFLLGVLSPAGAVGGREGGTTGLAALLSLPSLPTDTIAVVSVVVSASEIIVYTACGALAAVYLRPWKLLKAGPAAPAKPPGAAP